jgi:hypothetical protein
MTEGIELYLQPSKFVNKNRVLDKAIRTIRDKVGEDFSQFFKPAIVKSVMEEYNITPMQPSTTSSLLRRCRCIGTSKNTTSVKT